MDRLYRRQRHFYNLTRKYYLFGRDRLLRDLDPPEGGRVLEIGCGTGRNLVIAARHNPHALFYGVDISQEMLTSAQSAAVRAGLTGRVFTAPGDAERVDARQTFNVKDGFDRVVFSYCLSMIPDWEAALANGISQLSPDGRLHIVDFGDMAPWPGPARSARQAWLSHFHVTPREDLFEIARLLGGAHGLVVKPASIAGSYAWSLTLAPAQPS